MCRAGRRWTRSWRRAWRVAVVGGAVVGLGRLLDRRVGGAAAGCEGSSAPPQPASARQAKGAARSGPAQGAQCPLLRARRRPAQEASRSFCASGSDSSFFSVWFSIWRIRSARDVERAPDLLQRPRPPAREAEAHLDDLALALRQARRARGARSRGAGSRRRARTARRRSRPSTKSPSSDSSSSPTGRSRRDRLLGHAQDVAHPRAACTRGGRRSPRASARGRGTGRAGARPARPC